MRQDGVACSYTAGAFAWQFFTVPDCGCDSVVEPSHAQGKETTEVGCALLEGELQLGRVGSADLLPWHQVLSTGVTSLLFSHSLPPSKHQPTCAAVYLCMHTSTFSHPPSMRAHLDVHTPTHLCMRTSVHSGIHPCISAHSFICAPLHPHIGYPFSHLESFFGVCSGSTLC